MIGHNIHSEGVILKIILKFSLIPLLIWDHFTFSLLQLSCKDMLGYVLQNFQHAVQILTRLLLKHGKPSK